MAADRTVDLASFAPVATAGAPTPVRAAGAMLTITRFTWAGETEAGSGAGATDPIPPTGRDGAAYGRRQRGLHSARSTRGGLRIES